MANVNNNTYKKSTNTEPVALIDGRQTNSFTPFSSNIPVTKRTTPSATQAILIEPSAHPTIVVDDPVLRAQVEAEFLAELAECGGIASEDLARRWPGWMTPPIVARTAGVVGSAGISSAAMAALHAAFSLGAPDTPDADPLVDEVADGAAYANPVRRARIEAKFLAELEECGGIASRDLARRWPGWMTPPIVARSANGPNGANGTSAAMAALHAAFSLGAPNSAAAAGGPIRQARSHRLVLSPLSLESPKQVAERRLREVSEVGGEVWTHIMTLAPEIDVPETRGAYNPAMAAISVAASGRLPEGMKPPPSRIEIATELLTELVRLDGKANRALLNKWPHWLLPRPSDRYARENEALQKLEALGGIANVELANQWPGWMAPPILDSSITLLDFLAAYAAENSGVT